MPDTATAQTLQTEAPAFDGEMPPSHRSAVMTPLRRLQITLAGVAVLLAGCAHQERTTGQEKQETPMTQRGEFPPPPASVSVLGKIYDLDGGSKVIVHQPFGSTYYSAVVDMKGDYPGPGLVAHDIGRSEFVYVLDGSLNITLNKTTYTVNAGENILIRDGDYYYISGQGRAMVVVYDQPGGTSAIEPAK